MRIKLIQQADIACIGQKEKGRDNAQFSSGNGQCDHKKIRL